MTTRFYGEPRHCPIPGCERVVAAGHLMCPAHWRTVPKPVQREVWRTWRTWNRTFNDDDWDAYINAREAALGHVDV